AAHRVHVAQGVGGGNLAVNEGVVDDGGKKVDGLHNGQVVREAVHARIVVRLDADEQVRVGGLGQMAQDLRDPLWGQLARSAGARGVVDQAFFAAEKKHYFVPL